MKYLAIVLIVVALALSISGCDDVGKALVPVVPVVVTTRESAVGAGRVAQFHNQTNTQLTVSVVFKNQKKDERKETSFNIPPNGTFEIGWLEGWALESGETITISHPSYRDKTWTVP